MNASLQQLLDRGTALLRAGRATEARQLANSLMERLPDNPEVHLFAADAAQLAGDRAGAVACLDRLPETVAATPRVRLKRARLLLADSRRAAALETVRAAMAEHVADERALLEIARILTDCQDVEGAHRWLVDVVGRFPESVLLRQELALAEFHLGRSEAAEAQVEAVLARAPFHPAALHLRSQLRTQEPERNHLEDLRNRLAEGPKEGALVVAGHYALGKELEDLGRYAEAFEAFRRGAAEHRRHLRHDADAERAAQEEIRRRFTRTRFEALAPGHDEAGPIFVVGMPRSGTTLVERLLATHPQVTSIGEFTDFPLLLGEAARRAAPDEPSDVEASLTVDFAALGRRYLEAARDLAGNTPRFVDKLPYNFLYCGYLLAALPRARIVHLVRDPLDTAYAVFKTLFFRAYSFSYDLDELGDYLVSYRRHMAHWHSVLPGRILDVSYEALVRDTEGEARRLLDWCGLAWDEQVLGFHRNAAPSMTASALQVRQPVHDRSIGSWRRAETALDGLRERFRAEGLMTE